MGVAPVPEPLPVYQQGQLKTLPAKWTDEYARSVVRSDFGYAEAYRTHAHDWRYRNASELYLAWAGQRYWDGTRVPRSSLGIYVVFEQVESMLPKIVSALCDTEGYNFYSDRSDQDDHALAWRRLVLNQLAEVGSTEHIRRIAKSSLIYGNGVAEVGFEDYENEAVVFDRRHTAKSWTTYHHPIVGPVPVPTQIDTSYSRKVSQETKSRPYIRYTSLIDFYMDPNNESQRPQDAGYVIKRIYMRAGDVAKLRGKKNFNIPDDATLAQYSRAKTTANQDVTKLSAELFRYNLWNPAQDYSADPAQRRIEVLHYTTPERKVFMLNREHVAYNQPNKYKEINYFSMSYADVLDRWHALAMSDVAEGEQRLQQAITNARVDELALSIHRPMIKRRGVTIPQYQLRVKPGQVIETENPDNDIKQMEVQNITQQAFVEVEASERRVQRITGMSDLAALGSPSSGGNSASRTATGVNTQVGATNDRVKYYVANAESSLVEPVLNAFIRYNKLFLDVTQAANWLRIDPDFQHLDPLEVMNANIKAECRASIKMAGRMGFLQLLPLILQDMVNPQVLQLMALQQKKTMNVQELERMIWDAIGYTPRNPLWIDMKPEQVQAMQTPPPAERLKAQIAQLQTQATSEDKNKANITKLFGVALKTMFEHHGRMSDLDQKDQQMLMDAYMAQQQQESDAQSQDNNAE